MTLVARLERVATFFRLPHWPYDPEREVAREGKGNWRWLMLACWVMMAASLVATFEVSNQPLLCGFLGVLLIVSIPVAYSLHHRTTSRLLVNWIVFSAAFLLGGIYLAPLWPLRNGMWSAENLDFMGFLVLCFMWITAFRAFALRTARDLVETILPCGSVILLALVVKPSPLALGCMALVVLGALALLAAQHSIDSRREFHPLVTVNITHDQRRAGAFYSWPTLYALVLIAGVLVAYTAAHSELSGTWADYVRYTLARQVMRWFQPHENYLLPDPGVMLWRLDSWPNSELPVFKARTKIPGNWRVTCYHTYQRQWWQAGRQKATRAPYNGKVFRLPLAAQGASQLGAQRVEQEIWAVKYLQVSLPSLFCPVSVETDLKKVRYDRDGVIRIQGFVRSYRSYKVVSFLPPVIPMQRPGTEVDAALLQADLQLPSDLPPRIRNLAVEVTREAKTPYEKAREIERYLQDGFKYTTTAPVSYPNDFFDYFLFVSKRGFCHHFAGSMVIMCRCLGLPARLASGYLQGEEDKNEADLYTIREKDAHVWPEVYFRGAGWVAFEPTPPAPEETNLFQTAWKQISAGSLKGGQAALAFFKSHWPSLTSGLLGLALLLSLAYYRHRQRYLRAYRGDDPQSRLVRVYVRMRHFLAEQGASAEASLSPREFLATLPEELAHLRQEAGNLTENYLQARFGRTGPSAAQALAAEEAFASLRRNLKQRPSPATPS